MKNIYLLATAYLLFASCQKEVTCTCRDENGALVKQTSLKSKRSETEQFKADCEKMKVASYNGTTTVYTPCTVN